MPKDTLRSQKLGDVNEPNPEQRDYFDPAPIPRAEIKEMATGDEFKTCGVGITFTYDLDQEAVVVHRVVVDGPADRSEQIGPPNSCSIVPHPSPCPPTFSTTFSLHTHPCMLSHSTLHVFFLQTTFPFSNPPPVPPSSRVAPCRDWRRAARGGWP